VDSVILRLEFSSVLFCSVVYLGSTQSKDNNYDAVAA